MKASFIKHNHETVWYPRGGNMHPAMCYRDSSRLCTFTCPLCMMLEEPGDKAKMAITIMCGAKPVEYEAEEFSLTK